MHHCSPGLLNSRQIQGLTILRWRWGEKGRVMSNLTRRNLLAAACAGAGLTLVEGRLRPLMAATDPGFKETMTTMFWVGEPADASNAFISNAESYWDKNWLASFGGVDDPWERAHHMPLGFTPRENPFYVALPFGEFAPDGKLKAKARAVPWYQPGLTPLLKNRWVEIRHNLRVCFAQWQDVGPCGEDDFAFVFGTSLVPLNTFDAKAGLDVSPAVWNALGMKENTVTAWRFVDESEVPEGPWTDIITVSGNNR
jgi:hypothetical protein